MNSEDRVPTFDLVRAEQKVRLRNGDVGEVVEYTLREMDGTARDSYLNNMTARVRMVDGKAAGIKDFTAMQANLLTRCMYDENNKLVPIATIQGWPSSTQISLFKLAQKMNGLGDEAEAEDDEGN